MRSLLVLVSALSLAACSTSSGESPADAGAEEPGDADVAGVFDAGTKPGPDAGTPAPDAASVPLPGRKVLLYTGAGGGGPTSDLYLSDVASTLQAAGIASTTSESLPSGFANDYGVLWLMNPMQSVPADVSAAAKALLERGGRVVLVLDHCKNGCWSDADGDNDLLTTLGSAIRVSGTGGAPLSETTLQITPVPKITDGVSSVVVYYSGSVTGGTIFGRVPGGDGVMAYQTVGLGDVVTIADTSAFGYALSEGDNTRLIANLSVPRR
ncbi:MAG: hypothetical protein QM765_52000 [Myxococcales bacterium]